MRALIREHGTTLEVTFTGYLDQERVRAFHELSMKKLLTRPVVFNLSGIAFVGSSGIKTFLDALADIQKHNPESVRCRGWTPELKRLATIHRPHLVEEI